MRDRAPRRPPLLQRAARIAFAFVMMNVCAVQGLFAFLFRRKVWR